MPVWNPPANGYANAFAGITLPPTVKVETKGASAYEQEQMGQRSETSQVVPINRGEIEKTAQGDYLQQTRTVVTATESYEELATFTDIGAGATGLVESTPVQVDGENYDVVTDIPQSSAQGQLETAEQANNQTFFQPETAPVPVWWEPLPVEQQPVDQPQYVPLGTPLITYNEETGLYEPYFEQW